MDTKPKVFCGSSSESLRVVYEIRKQLDETAAIVAWKGLIRIGDYTLDKLLALVPTFSFGIFVFSADDTIERRNKRLLVARDNVVLELGLFMERLGRKRTFLVVQDVDPILHLPSDLSGLTVARFRLPEEFSPSSAKKLAKVPPAVLSEALVPACDELRDAILEGAEPLPVPEVLSGGMLYLLRYLETRAYSSSGLAPALVHFQTKRKIADLPIDEQKSWVKATQYACQCLRALNLVSTFDGGSYYRISEQGRRLMGSEDLKEMFGSELKMKKVRILPSRR